MKHWSVALFLGVFLLLNSCQVSKKSAMNAAEKPFDWRGANVYFLLVDRFQNGDPTNDVQFGRTEKTAVLRGFEGGDLRGVIQKIDEGYFSDLGVNAIWMTPIVEQIHGATDEGTGNTYGFHGYWAKDWTTLDPNFGTEKDLKELVEKAHKKGIRIVLDAVINHTGPVTQIDEVYPNSWVRTSPQCTYDNYKNTTACTLVKNLPDILTESNAEAQLPKMLVDKWKKEGRYEQEMNELDVFFAQNNLPKAPKYYIMKWLSDYVRDYGIDGYRVDTVKHTNEDVWKEFQKVCQKAFDEYKAKNPKSVLDNSPFFTVGEVYGYGISQELNYNFGDKLVNYYDNGFTGLINFDFKGDAEKSYEETFKKYNAILNGNLSGKTVMNYATSHDDGSPFDRDRKRTFETATKLLITPGISQIYYGDETARPLNVQGADGDANLRSNMNWAEIKNNTETQKLLSHYQKLGQFRANHPAVGAGVHQQLGDANSYYFVRSYKKGAFEDQVVIGLDVEKGEKKINVLPIFEPGTKVRDAYSGATSVVSPDGSVLLNTSETIVLLEKI